MANRHLSRSIILQTLFEWDFKGKPEDGIEESLTRNITEFGPGLDDTPFIEHTLDEFLKRKDIIDEIITKAAPEWPLEKINAVDRAILRIGLTELLFGNYAEVPPKVAINEAIELAKTFGGESSSKFINGVLGAVYKEIGEPGKDETSKMKRTKNDAPIDPSTLPLEQKAGAVVYCKHEGQVLVAFVHDIFGFWTLPKGGVEEGESTEIAAVREVKEEIGIDIHIEQTLGENEYIASHPEKGKIRKHVTFFLAKAEYRPLVLEISGGLTEAKWFALADMPGLKMYDDITSILTQAVEKILSA